MGGFLKMKVHFQVHKFTKAQAQNGDAWAECSYFGFLFLKSFIGIWGCFSAAAVSPLHRVERS